MRKHNIHKLFLLLLLFWAFFTTPQSGYTCGHEGFYLGLGYSQLLMWSPDKRLVSGNLASNQNVKWDTRYGGYGKFGYDFCGSRMGVEVPVSYDRQKLNRLEMVNVFNSDLNAIIHLVETNSGWDFFWILGTGFSFITEGGSDNDSSTAGVNFNVGPGLRYYFLNGNNKTAVELSVPARYSFYLGHHLSNNTTQVLGIPIRFGLTFGF